MIARLTNPGSFTLPLITLVPLMNPDNGMGISNGDIFDSVDEVQDNVIRVSDQNISDDEAEGHDAPGHAVGARDNDMRMFNDGSDHADAANLTVYTALNTKCK